MGEKSDIKDFERGFYRTPKSNFYLFSFYF